MLKVRGKLVSPKMEFSEDGDSQLFEHFLASVSEHLHRDFPLRGFVTCAACGKPLTASWCRGRTALYGYYFCRNKMCIEYSKSIPKKATRR